MNNFEIYDAVKTVPENAKKTIGAGRLKGMTDINPMWRIQKLTEQFGTVGIGWYYKIVKQWTEEGSDGTKCAFVNIELYIKIEGDWSAPIEGTGGSMLVSKEKGGLYTSDEAYKMALTDAISVACKALGMGADVYWAGGRTKYSKNNNEPFPEVNNKISTEQINRLTALTTQLKDGGKGFLAWLKGKYGTDDITTLTNEQYIKVLTTVAQNLEKEKSE